MEDKDIIRRYRDTGTRHAAFTVLVRKYQKKIYWHIRRIVIDHDDADDVVQNVFIKAWKGLENFREDAQLYTWLYRIATNESITFLNQKKNRNNIPMDEVEHALSSQINDDPYFKGEEIERKLQQAILTLPEKQRIVFNLKYFDEMKYEEMSQVLETSVGALKASYHHAVKKIENYLTQG